MTTRGLGMSSRTASDFIDRVKSAGLLSSDRLLGAESLQDSGAVTDASLATEFVGRKLITQYQADKLLADEGSSLLIADRYEVREQLGAGGMGEVYLARDRQLDRDVAIKVLPARMVPDPDAIARFEREAKAMARLSHPNIVQAFDAGSDGGKHFLVMEHVDAANLSQRLRESGKIEPPLAADFAYQTALGLDHAHGKGLIHRDLKPSNLLVTKDGTVKVLDMGLAKFAQDQIDDESITVAGAGLGTPDYMAPEQFGDAKNADVRSDIYSLGCTLFHTLAGRVPFPGSSLSEKQRAHQNDEPDPVEHLAPNVPVGLAQAVVRMLAKRPVDRFQSARECAEALTPYVAASSTSLPNLKATVDWEGSHLTIVTAERRKRRLTNWIAIAMLTALAGIGIGFGIAQLGGENGEDHSSKPQGNAIAANTKTEPPAEKSKPGKSDVAKTKQGRGKRPDRDTPKPSAKPWVLTVAKDGSGKFKTITAALDAAEPGMTIRILDDQEYDEQVRLSARNSGLTIVAEKSATIVNSTDQSIAMMVNNAENLTIRGLLISLKAKRQTCLALRGDCSGTVFQDVQFIATRAQNCIGIEYYATNRDLKKPPTEFRNCLFRELFFACSLVGYTADRKTAKPCRGIRVRDNRFVGCAYGVYARGSFERVQLVGNQFLRCAYVGVQFQDLLPGVKSVLVANNTFFGNNFALRLWDDRVIASDLQVRNNLVLAPVVTDFAFVDSGGTEETIRGPGDVAKLRKTWTFTENWREIRPPEGTGLEVKAWISPAKSSVVQDAIKVLSRDPTNPDFLCPPANSKLATEGCGRTDPALPNYVGAVPPKGVVPWDWGRTWRAPPGKNKVLTVSQNGKDGAKYDSINAALKDAKPWDTIRVLDAATYSERVTIQDESRYKGLVLESVAGATIASETPRGFGILIRAPHVTMRGFRLLANTEQATLIGVARRATGVTLERLAFAPGSHSDYVGIHCESLALTDDDLPVVIRDCAFRRAKIAVAVVGSGSSTRRVVVRDNDLFQPDLGILLIGTTQQMHIVGNRISDATMSAIQLQNVTDATDNVLIANNTVYKSDLACRLWDDAVRGKGIRVSHNLFFGNPSQPDMVFTMADKRGDGRLVGKTWHLHNNWREVRPLSSWDKSWIPTGTNDVLTETISDINRDEKSADFLRPKRDTPLAAGGGGGDLPKYAGAVPAKGREPWDWGITWRSRTMRARYAVKTEPKTTKSKD